MRSLVGSIVYTIFLLVMAAVAVMNALGTYLDAAQLKKEALLGFTWSEALWMILVISVFVMALQVWNRQRAFERSNPKFTVSTTRRGFHIDGFVVRNDSPKVVNVTGRAQLLGHTGAAIVVWEETGQRDINLRPTEQGTITLLKSEVIKRDGVEWHDLRLHSAREGKPHWFLGSAHDVHGPTSDMELVLTLTPDTPSPHTHQWKFRLVDDHVFSWGYTLEAIQEPDGWLKQLTVKTGRSVRGIGWGKREVTP